MIGIIVVLGGLILLGRHTSKPLKFGTTVADPSALPGLQTGTTTPWAVELTSLKSRLDAARPDPGGVQVQGMRARTKDDVKPREADDRHPRRRRSRRRIP